MPIELTATNTLGSDTEAWNVQPAAPSSIHDDEFDEDPTTNAALWQFYEPQTGVQYGIVEDGDSGWWRLDVPELGDLGLNFDTWLGVDRAPQLRREVPAGDTFLLETRVRLAVDRRRWRGSPSSPASW